MKSMPIDMEIGNFTPLVFLTSGGMSKECKQFINRLANLQARRKGEEYGDVVRVLRNQAEICPSQNNSDSPERPP